MAEENKPKSDHHRDNRGNFRSPRRRPGGDVNGQIMSDRPANELVEKVIFINRSSKVVKGGRRFSFSALVVTGDRHGRVGLGAGKATEVAEAIRKGTENAKNNLETIHLEGNTIPHDVIVDYDGARVLLRPASDGTGVIAGKTVRAVLESAGVKNVLTKSLGSSNAANVAKATLSALRALRLKKHIYQARGLELATADKGGDAAAAVQG